jgi:beta-1,4-N-acetylglucosaminyltransferase
MSRRAFVIVGSTKFSELVRTVLSSETTNVLSELGFDELCVQYGTDKQLFADQTQGQSKTISITGFDYSSSIEEEMESADLIISHAGSTFFASEILTSRIRVSA